MYMIAVVDLPLQMCSSSSTTTCSTVVCSVCSSRASDSCVGFACLVDAAENRSWPLMALTGSYQIHNQQFYWRRVSSMRMCTLS